MNELFRLSGFGFTYPQQRRPALTGVDLTIRSGEFWVLCGPSGCGKSTLLRQLKTVLTPHGVTEGEVYFQGTPLRDVPLRQQAADIGFVLQSPEHQVVTDKVWHELAFGLESLGCDTPSIRRRVAEMASFFGIQDWFHKSVDELSGGQKQLLSLASVMVMQPKVLILDEPTSQLDPIAAADFLQTLGRINRELGTTVLLTEHRLEEALPLATHAAVLDGGDCAVGVESTVLDLAHGTPRLLRPGGITPAMLREVCGELEIHPAVTAALKDGAVAASPGMKYKHYAPRAHVILVKGSPAAFAAFVNSHAAEKPTALCFDGEEQALSVPYLTYGARDDHAAQAREVFDALRKLDDRGAELVYAACPDADGVGLAVYNRLLRAAGFEVIDLG